MTDLTDFQRLVHDPYVEKAKARIRELTVEAEQLRAERDAARQWFEDHFAGEDDEPDEMTLAQLMAAVFKWGDEAWGAAGQESQRADDANSRFVKEHERAEAAARAGGCAADALREIEKGSIDGRAIRLARDALAAYEKDTA